MVCQFDFVSQEVRAAEDPEFETFYTKNNTENILLNDGCQHLVTRQSALRRTELIPGASPRWIAETGSASDLNCIGLTDGGRLPINHTWNRLSFRPTFRVRCTELPVHTCSGTHKGFEMYSPVLHSQEQVSVDRIPLHTSSLAQQGIHLGSNQG